MAVSVNTTYYATGKAEDFEDIIYNISPEEAPFLQAAGRGNTATQTLHQWQTDTLSAAGANINIEGDDASYATLAASVNLANYTQILDKTVQVSATYDAVKKYGRKSQTAYELMKAGKSLKLDLDYAACRNQIGTAGGSATGRSMAGFESWIVGNFVRATGSATGTIAGYTTTPGVAMTDGTASTFIEADLKTALQAAWTDGGDPSLILMAAVNKNRFDSFAGIATKYNNLSGQDSSRVVTYGASDIYVSSFGNHTVKLSRQVRTQTVLCIDPEFIGMSTLQGRGITKTELAKTGDSTKWMINTEQTLVMKNPDAHALIINVGA